MQCLHYWAPFPRSSSNFLWSVHAHRAPYAAARGCKRGVGPWARCRGRGAPGLSNAWRPTRFIRLVPARRARPGPRSPSAEAISPSSEGLSGPHHADKTNFSGGQPPKAKEVLAQRAARIERCTSSSRQRGSPPPWACARFRIVMAQTCDYMKNPEKTMGGRYDIGYCLVPWTLDPGELFSFWDSEWNHESLHCGADMNECRGLTDRCFIRSFLYPISYGYVSSAFSALWKHVCVGC